MSKITLVIKNIFASSTVHVQLYNLHKLNWYIQVKNFMVSNEACNTLFQNSLQCTLKTHSILQSKKRNVSFMNIMEIHVASFLPKIWLSFNHKKAIRFAHVLGKCSAIFSPCIRCLEQCSRRLLIYVCIMSVCFSGHWSWVWLQVGTFSYLNFSIQKIFSLSLFHLQNDHLNRIISIIKLVLGTNTLTTWPYRHVHNTNMLNTPHYEHFSCSQRN